MPKTTESEVVFPIVGLSLLLLRFSDLLFDQIQAPRGKRILVIDFLGDGSFVVADFARGKLDTPLQIVDFRLLTEMSHHDGRLEFILSLEFASDLFDGRRLDAVVDLEVNLECVHLMQD